MADVVIIRHQQIATDPELWRKIFQQAFDRMTEHSVLIVTSYTDEEHEELIKLVSQLNGRIIAYELHHGYPIPGTNGASYDKDFTIIKKG